MGGKSAHFIYIVSFFVIIYFMLTWIEINKKNIKDNLKQIRKIVGEKVKIMAVVKSNAYGHGIIEIAKIASESEADWLGVINLDEAIKIRKSGIKAPIFILSYWDDENLKRIRDIRSIDFPVYNLIQAKTLSDFGKKIKKKVNIHIKIDTGTSRLGIMPEQTINFVKRIKKLPNLKIRGIFSHFAASETNIKYTNLQIKRFQNLINKLEKNNINIPIKHISCSASTLISFKSHFDLVRIGLMMYGLWPSEKTKKTASKKYPWFKLKPALSWKTKIIQVKEVSKNTPIGYDCSYKTKKRTKLAILPVGYNEGYDRHLSNIGQVLICGKRCFIRGRICMNLTIVDVTKLKDVKVGDEVVLIGKQGKEYISAEEIAKKIGTINYEVVTRINPLIPRKYK